MMNGDIGNEPEWLEEYKQIHDSALRNNEISEFDLYSALRGHRNHNRRPAYIHNLPYQQLCAISLIGILSIAIGIPLLKQLYEQMIGVRCFIPNNYMIWEATRPVADCTYCRGITQPRILPNVTQSEFQVFSVLFEI